MSPHLAAALIIVSALLHAAWNALLHAHRQRAREATSVVLIMSFALSLIAAWATSGAFPWQLYGSVWVWLSGLSEGIYFLSLGVVYQRLSLGLGYLMMRGLSMLGVTVCSVLLLGEELSAVKIAGMAAAARRTKWAWRRLWPAPSASAATTSVMAGRWRRALSP
jgi:multidrug transporter EmrE-like cation transporter